MSLPRVILLEMVRSDLELAYEHLENGREDLALHELNRAQEKISQLSQLKEVAAPQQPLLTLPAENDHHFDPATRSDSEVNR